MTYQPRWDTFGRFIQPLASRVPLMTTSGNRALNTAFRASANAAALLPYYLLREHEH